MSEKILVVGPAWVGDMMMAQSLFRLLSEQRSKPIIDVLAPAWTLPLLHKFPEVRNSIPLPFGHGEFAPIKRWHLGKALRREHYDQAIVLPNSFKSAIIPFAAKARRRTGFRGEMRYGLLNDIRPLDKTALYKTVERFLFLGLRPGEQLQSEIPQPQLITDPDNARTVFMKLGQPWPQQPILGICPGAEYGPAKRWPPDYFIEVAHACTEQGWVVWLFGSEKDRAITVEIEKGLDGSCVNLAGRTSLVDAIDLMAACQTVLTNDSGLMHVAAAAGAKLVAIFGSSDPEHTPPLTDKADVYYLGLDCSPCFKRECPLGHTNCLGQIKPEIIIQAVLRN